MIEQDGCEEVVIEQKTYKGKFPKRSSGSPVENVDHKKVEKGEKRTEKHKPEKKELTAEETENLILQNEEKKKQKELRKKEKREKKQKYNPVPEAKIKLKEHK